MGLGIIIGGVTYRGLGAIDSIAHISKPQIKPVEAVLMDVAGVLLLSINLN